MTVLSIVIVLAASMALAGFTTRLLLEAFFHALGRGNSPAGAQPQD